MATAIVLRIDNRKIQLESSKFGVADNVMYPNSPSNQVDIQPTEAYLSELVIEE